MPDLQRFGHACAVHRDRLAGLLMFAIGVGAISGGRSYDIGTLRQMGPGFFPMCIGVFLCASGLLISLARPQQPLASDETSTAGVFGWRGPLCICLSIVVFIAGCQYGGLLPAAFFAVAVASRGDPGNTWRTTATLAFGMTIACVAVFWWGLQLQLPLIAWGQYHAF